MRDQQLVLPFGSLSVRKFFLSAAAIIMASLLYLFATAPAVQAQATSNASWSGDSIIHNQRSYKPTDNSTIGDGHKLAAGTQIYAFIEPLPSDILSDTKRLHLIYFAPGTDPLNAQSANAISFDFTPPNTYTNPTGVGVITISSTPATASTGTSNCNVTGIGWAVCPTTNFLAKSMDWLFGVLADFLTVQPLQSNPDNALYTGWSVIRNFANVAFIMAFLIIIYSQLTSLGLSNYGIKKMFPRLIIAAILVNVSYWICTAAVDISNILGYSLQDVLMGIREKMAGTNAAASEVYRWESVTAAVLGGVTLGTAGLIGLVSIGSVTGAIAMLLPTLVIVIIAALVAILLMAVRQALIVILVIIAPLAFVAFLLPNTEKYFEKWRGLFITMLMLFPIFAVIFGGSQIAGTAIIQNANSIVMLILGMATQVAPLFILPFLIKFSGGLIGQIAGIANDKSKGLLDRTRNFSKEYADLKKSRVQSRPAPRTRLGRALRLKGMVQGAENRRLSREHEMKTNQTMAENRWRGSKKFEALDTASREAERAKEILENQHNTHWNVRARLDAKSLEQELKLRVTGDEASAAKARLEAVHEEFKTGRLPVTGSLSNIMNRSQDATRDLALTALRKQSAERTQKSQLTDSLKKNTLTIDGTTLREYAGGIRGVEGAESALAAAVAASREEYGKMTAEKAQLIRHFNLSSEKRQELALGMDVDTDDGTYTFKANDSYAREAAIEEQLKTGSFKQIREIIKESGAVKDAQGNVIVKGLTHDYATTISQAIPANGIANKAVFFGTKAIDDIAQGKFYGDEGINRSIVYNISNGKVKDEVLAGMDADAIRSMFTVGLDPATLASIAPADRAAFQENVRALQHSAHHILTTDVLNRSSSTAAKKVLADYQVPPPTP